jgi:hypothetical protein
MPRLFTPSLAKKYEDLYQQNGVKFRKVIVASSIQVPLFLLFQSI